MDKKFNGKFLKYLT